MKMDTAAELATGVVNAIASGPDGLVLIRDKKHFSRAKMAIMVAIAAGIEGERKRSRSFIRRAFNLSDPNTAVHNELAHYIDNDPLMSKAMDIDLLKKGGDK